MKNHPRNPLRYGLWVIYPLCPFIGLILTYFLAKVKYRNKTKMFSLFSLTSLIQIRVLPFLLASNPWKKITILLCPTVLIESLRIKTLNLKPYPCYKSKLWLTRASFFISNGNYITRKDKSWFNIHQWFYEFEFHSHPHMFFRLNLSSWY